MKQTSISDFFSQCKQPEPCQKRKSEYPDTLKKSLKPEPSLPKRSIIVIPPSKVANLSSSTLSLINSIQRTNKPTSRSPDEILSSVKPREKYQELLEPIWKLPLPYKFNRLLQIQNYLDTVINNYKLRGLQATFTSIKQCVEKTYNTYIDLEHIQKLLYLQPEFYKITQNSNSDLIVDLPGSEVYTLSDFHNRNSSIKSKLTEIVKSLHNDHLSALNINFDQDICKTWHSSFNLHEISDIPAAPIPILSSKNFIETSQARVLRLSILCKLLLKIFRKHQTPSLFFKSLVKKICENKKIGKEDEAFVINDVVEICEIFCGWINIIKTESGDVVRMNRSMKFDLQIAREKIREKYR